MGTGLDGLIVALRDRFETALLYRRVGDPPWLPEEERFLDRGTARVFEPLVEALREALAAAYEDGVVGTVPWVEGEQREVDLVFRMVLLEFGLGGDERVGASDRAVGEA